jgi:peptide/nickel transport system substrate-binding protein
MSALDAFFESYYRLRPVNATFTGVHEYDHLLPDWSPEGLDSALAEMRALRRTLDTALERGALQDVGVRDRALAAAFLDVQIAEHESGHFARGNPSLAAGEAIFAVISLMTRPFAPLRDRVDAAISRLNAIPSFLDGARRSLPPQIPAAWKHRTLRECEGADRLLYGGILKWIDAENFEGPQSDPLIAASIGARRAFNDFRQWVAAVEPAAAGCYGCGGELFDLLLARGHWQTRSRSDLLAEARAALDDAIERVHERSMAIADGGWPEVEARLADRRPSAADYLADYQYWWDKCRERAEACALVTWPSYPIRYVPIPEHTRDAAPLLYYLFYRSPAPFDRLPMHDYVVPAAATTSAIKLNHVVHHGAIGHHVQNYYAYTGDSEIGRVAAVDCASRIGMFAGGTMAEGWACYATELMDEAGFLTPEESVAEQHTRARLLARAVVDIGLHEGSLTFDEGISVYRDRIGMSEDAAAAETCKNSMFPATALMYWLGLSGLQALRREREKAEGSSFSLRRFHDRLLRFGSIPVPLIAQIFALLVLVAGCGPRSALNAPSNDLLVVGYDREPDTLNRFSSHILEDIHACVVEGLTTTNERMEIVPLLATEVPTLENGGVRLQPDGGMDVEWKLRPGVKWHDGVAFTSADIKFTVEAINGPNYNPESTDGFDRISSVDTPDPLTAIVHYREVYAPYANQFMRGALPKHLLEGRDIDRAQDYNRAPLGTGPYRVAEWKSGEYILLERVPNYWRGSEYPKIRRLMFKFIANTNTRVNQLKAGEVHVVALVPWDKHREIVGQPSIVVHKTPGNAYEHVTLNQRQVPAFADVRVRRALIYAIDRETLARTILDGLAPIADGPIQPLSWAYTDRITKYPFDPAKARALLDEAGWKDANGDGLRDRDGRPFAFTLITQAGFNIRENVAQALQHHLRQVGVDMRIELVDGTAISSRWFAGRFDAMLHWWQMPADPELTLFFAADRTPPAGRNINYFADATLTEVLYASDRTVDRAERTRLLQQAQMMVSDAVPEIPLYSITRLDAVPVTLHNFKGNPTNTGVFWNVHEWEIK